MDERFVIRDYLHQDKSAVNQLISQAFGPEHAGRSVWKLRLAKPIEKLGLIVEDMSISPGQHGDKNNRIVGSLQFWPVKINDYPSLLFGPLAVKFYLRGLGVGRLLVEKSLKQIRNNDWDFCIVSGEPDYYPKFGFKPVPDNFIWPGPIERQRLQYISLRNLSLEKLSYRPLTILSDIG